MGISFLALNLFSWLFCQWKKRSLQWESVWKYISITALLASVPCFHLGCSRALTGSRLQQLGCQHVCFLVACFILPFQTQQFKTILQSLFFLYLNGLLPLCKQQSKWQWNGRKCSCYGFLSGLSATVVLALLFAISCLQFGDQAVDSLPPPPECWILLEKQNLLFPSSVNKWQCLLVNALVSVPVGLLLGGNCPSWAVGMHGMGSVNAPPSSSIPCISMWSQFVCDNLTPRGILANSIFVSCWRK